MLRIKTALPEKRDRLAVQRRQFEATGLGVLQLVHQQCAAFAQRQHTDR